RLLARGVDPLLAHDMARYPWWFQRFEVGPNFWLQTAVGGLLVWYWMWLADGQRENTRLYLVYFGFLITSAAVVMRALSSGANIVVQEKEERTLPHLLLTPLGARHIVALKLRVVLYQTLPPLVVLTVACWMLGMATSQWTGLWVIALAAAVAGVLASMVAPTRLVAMITAGLLCAGVLALNGVVGDAIVRPFTYQTLIGPGGAIHSDLLQTVVLRSADFVAAAVCVAVCALVWLALRPLGVRAMFRHAAAR
ncbi:MAG: hypothetical protein HYU66_18345, partial [Armatimonadetes bacterium]|nr:hypothetical protein [Armatimonadota bacterium]